MFNRKRGLAKHTYSWVVLWDLSTLHGESGKIQLSRSLSIAKTEWESMWEKEKEVCHCVRAELTDKHTLWGGKFSRFPMPLWWSRDRVNISSLSCLRALACLFGTTTLPITQRKTKANWSCGKVNWFYLPLLILRVPFLQVPVTTDWNIEIDTLSFAPCGYPHGLYIDLVFQGKKDKKQLHVLQLTSPML